MIVRIHQIKHPIFLEILIFNVRATPTTPLYCFLSVKYGEKGKTTIPTSSIFYNLAKLLAIPPPRLARSGERVRSQKRRILRRRRSLSPTSRQIPHRRAARLLVPCLAPPTSDTTPPLPPSTSESWPPLPSAYPLRPDKFKTRASQGTESQQARESEFDCGAIRPSKAKLIHQNEAEAIVALWQEGGLMPNQTNRIKNLSSASSISASCAHCQAASFREGFAIKDALRQPPSPHRCSARPNLWQSPTVDRPHRRSVEL
jgi:hypothetical protein